MGKKKGRKNQINMFEYFESIRGSYGVRDTWQKPRREEATTFKEILKLLHSCSTLASQNNHRKMKKNLSLWKESQRYTSVHTQTWEHQIQTSYNVHSFLLPLSSPRSVFLMHCLNYSDFNAVFAHCTTFVIGEFKNGSLLGT